MTHKRNLDAVSRRMKRDARKNKLVPIGLILSLIVSFGVWAMPSTSSAADISSNLVSYWDFEEGTGAVATDLADSNDGALNGDAAWSSNVPAIAGDNYSVAFDGAGDYVSVPDAANLDISGEITVAGWIYLDSVSTQGTVAAKWKDINAVNERGYLLTVTLGGTPRFYISHSGVDYPFAAGAALTTGSWHYLAGTYDGANIKLYVDGALAATTNSPGAIHLNNEPLLIGANDGYGGSNRKYTDGNVDEVRVYNRALSAEDVQALFIDQDSDGVENSEDLCPGTVADTWQIGLGTNRYELHDDGIWYVKKPKTGAVVATDYEIADTYGCSGRQILDILSDKTGLDFEGHYKYGLSKSVLEEWISGWYHLETLAVDSADADGTDTVNSLSSSENYKFVVSGTFNAGDYIKADAKFSKRDLTQVWDDASGWTDAVQNYESYGTALLDLQIDGVSPDWGVYNPAHVYETVQPGSDAPANLTIWDVYYPNNVGQLAVDVYLQLW